MIARRQRTLSHPTAAGHRPRGKLRTPLPSSPYQATRERAIQGASHSRGSPVTIRRDAAEVHAVLADARLLLHLTTTPSLSILLPVYMLRTDASVRNAKHNLQQTFRGKIK